MLRRVINPFLLLPLTLSMNTFNVLSSETKNYIDNVLEEKSNITFVDYQEIENLVKQNKNIAFMGCSLGGYYALYFSQLHRSKAILINPAIPPLEGFEVYLGENENFSTREKFSITKKDIKYIRSISHDSFNNKKRTLVLLESGDEVLDYIKTISYFRGSHIDILFGGNHSYSSFENKLIKIQEFLQIH